MARALFAAGFRAGDLVHNSFSYHFTPAGAMMDSGAHGDRLHACFPRGTGQTELQVQAMADLRPDAYVGTPSFLRILLEKADETGRRLPSLNKALARRRSVSAERCATGSPRAASPPTRATARPTSAWSPTRPTRAKAWCVDEGVIVEIVRPGTGDPVADGEVGELVVTTLNPDYPLIRFGTGDLSAVLPGACPTGRTNQRIRGWLGRADQSAKVRGMFVHPPQVAEIVRRHPEVKQGAAGRQRRDGRRPDDAARSRSTARRPRAWPSASPRRSATSPSCAARSRCRAPGSLPNDGKVIEDTRKYD